MNYIISCKENSRGRLSFYLTAKDENYFLFYQKYKTGVNKLFSAGMRLDEAIDFSRAKGDFAVLHTMEKLPSYIRYIEREYDVAIFHKTEKKVAERKFRFA